MLWFTLTPNKHCHCLALTPNISVVHRIWKSGLPGMKTPRDLLHCSRESFDQFTQSFDVVLTDCDGVLWSGNTALKNSDKVIRKFREMGKKVVYLTNNSLLTRNELASKAVRLGFSDATRDDFLSSGYLTAKYLKDIGFKKKVYVIGIESMFKEMEYAGIRCVPEIGADTIGEGIDSYIAKGINMDPQVGAVIVSADDHFSYPKILKAFNYLRDPDCLFLATEKNISVPYTENLVAPGTGGFISCIEYVSGRTATLVGKPSNFVWRSVLKDIVPVPERTLMIGDTLNVDILFGNRCNMRTLLVLNNETIQKTIQRIEKTQDFEFVPDFLIPNLGILYDRYESGN